ncbi:MAG: hypothetical protein PVH40_06410 [Gemmatimonadales bacterium]|jgi:hypothetical protein
MIGAVLAACGGDPPHTGSTTTDSAGITIVESSSPVWDDASRWRLSAEPLVSIGVEEGPEAYQLYRVRSAVRLDDGRIVVANHGTSELRFYGRSGEFRFSRGGDGEGPGEFRSMGEIWPLADSLFVFDFRLRRVTVYSASGELGRSFPVSPTSDGAFVSPVCMLASRHLLMQRFPRDAELETGLNRDTSLYLRYGLDGEVVDTIGRFAGSESYVGKGEDVTFSTGAPWGRRSYVAPVGDGFYFGSSDRWEIEARSSDGTLERLIRRPVPNPVVTAAEADSYYVSLRERMTRMSGMWRGLYEDVTLPETKPAYGRILADAEGNLWVAAFEDESTWTVFDTEGRLLGALEIAGRVRVVDIGSDYVLGVWQDDLDVERVILYELLKP